jgi:hypothetical protein
MKRVTRRQLIVAAAASALAVKVAAQTPGPAPQSNQDFTQAAQESHRKNSMILASFPIPMSVEPAFQFKA